MKFPEFPFPDGSILIPAICLDCCDDLVCLQFWAAYRLDSQAKQIDGKWTCDGREKIKENKR
jgi:hypothetical protein